MSDKIKYGTVDILEDAFKPENTMISMVCYNKLEAECREYRSALEFYGRKDVYDTQEFWRHITASYRGKSLSEGFRKEGLVLVMLDKGERARQALSAGRKG